MGLFGPPNVEALKEKKNVKGLIKALSYPKDFQVRKSAAKALGEIRDSRAVEQLIATLQDEDSKVRKSAAKALASIGEDSAIEPLADTFKNEMCVYYNEEEISDLGLTAALMDLGKSLSRWKEVPAFAVMPGEDEKSPGSIVFHAGDGKGRKRDLKKVEKAALVFIQSDSLKWLKKDKTIWSRVANPKVSSLVAWDGYTKKTVGLKYTIETVGLKPRELKVKLMPTFRDAVKTVENLQYFFNECEEAYYVCTDVERALRKLGWDSK